MRAVTNPETLHLDFGTDAVVETPWGAFKVVGPCLGRGASSQVWAAEYSGGCAGVPRHVALKVGRAEPRAGLAAVREAEVLREVAGGGGAGAVRHAVRYVGYFLLGGAAAPHVVLVFERLGPSLLRLADVGPAYRRVCRAGRAAVAGMVLRQMLAALRDLHARGLTHGDVKPENILSADAGVSSSGLSVKLADFNHCVRTDEAQVGGDGRWQVGTLWYRSPELLEGRAHALFPACDVWALACVAGEVVCCGAPLFPADARLDDDAAARAMLDAIYAALPPPSSEAEDGAAEYAGCDADSSTVASSTPPSTAPSTPNSKELGDGAVPRPAAAPASAAASAAVPSAGRAFAYLFQAGVGEEECLLQDLLRAMLEVDPRVRITAAQALGHPFFAAAASTSAGCRGEDEGTRRAAAEAYVARCAAENVAAHAAHCTRRELAQAAELLAVRRKAQHEVQLTPQQQQKQQQQQQPVRPLLLDPALCHSF